MLELGFHQYNNRDALGNLALGGSNQVDSIRGQGALALQRLSDVLNGAPTGPMGQPVPALPVDSSLYKLLLEDGCVPNAPWQINCTTIYDGVAKNGGLVQPLLRIVSLGETLIRLEREANLAPGQAILLTSLVAQQVTFDVILMERFVTRDTIAAALRLILDEVTTEVDGHKASMYAASYGNLAFLLLCVAVTAVYLGMLHEWVLSARLLLLYVPEGEVTSTSTSAGLRGGGRGKVDKRFACIMQQHISEST
jgi:hypothetical protein